MKNPILAVAIIAAALALTACSANAPAHTHAVAKTEPASHSAETKLPVPDVIGKSRTDAYRTLQDAGFTPIASGDSDQPDFGYPDWPVSAQDPASGAMANGGTVVSLTINNPTPKPTPTLTPTPAVTPPQPSTVLYSVWGSGSSSTSITYSTANGSFAQEQANGAALPWSTTLPITGQYNIFVIVAQAGDGDSISCSISVNGRIITQQTSTGQYAVVSCSSG